MNKSKVELPIKEEVDSDLKPGDMFEWVTCNYGQRFIYLSKTSCPLIPLTLIHDERGGSYLNGWCGAQVSTIKEWIKDGTIKRLPSGTQFTVTQR